MIRNDKLYKFAAVQVKDDIVRIMTFKKLDQIIRTFNWYTTYLINAKFNLSEDKKQLDNRLLILE